MVIGKKKTFFGVSILWGLVFVLLVVVLIGGPGVHLGLWTPLDGFLLSIKGSFMGGIALMLLSLIVMIIIAMNKNCGGMGKTIVAFLVGLLLAAPVGYLRLSGGGGVPPIHDISTDMINPPAFKALVGARGEGANSLIYEGEGLAAQQKVFYPDIQPLMVLDIPEQAFAKALEVAGNMGWKITGVDAMAKRFEATDHSLWFNFADDIVIIITATETGSRIDIRCVSRVGTSDLGVNAKRIKAFQESFIRIT